MPPAFARHGVRRDPRTVRARLLVPEGGAIEGEVPIAASNNFSAPGDFRSFASAHRTSESAELPTFCRRDSAARQRTTEYQPTRAAWSATLPGVTTLVSRACQAGFLNRERATNDRRVVHLVLSEAGAARLATWCDLRAETLARALTDLHDGDRDAISAALPPLARLVARLEQLGDEVA